MSIVKIIVKYENDHHIRDRIDPFFFTIIDYQIESDMSTIRTLVVVIIFSASNETSN